MEFHLPSRTWWAPQKKLNDLSETLDELVDKDNPENARAFTVNQFERGLGILENFSQLSLIGRTLLLVPVAEMAFYLARFWKENFKKPSLQTEYCTLSAYARLNILRLRALLVISPTFPLPMEDPRTLSLTSTGADIALFSDASGKPKEITDPNYAPTCLGVYWPATEAGKKSRAYSFPLPYSFLAGYAISKGQGKSRKVLDQTVLLELLPVIAIILQHPAEFKGKTVMLSTDNQTTVNLYQTCSAKKVYTAYFLECLFFIIGTLDIKLFMKWRRRRSTQAMCAADDLTHGRLTNPGPEVDCRVLQLPPPLHKVVHGTLSYHSHCLDTLRSEVMNYLSDIFPGIKFPFC